MHDELCREYGQFSLTINLEDTHNGRSAAASSPWNCSSQLLAVEGAGNGYPEIANNPWSFRILSKSSTHSPPSVDSTTSASTICPWVSPFGFCLLGNTGPAMAITPLRRAASNNNDTLA
jgi:hypothetical protein